MGELAYGGSLVEKKEPLGYSSVTPPMNGEFTGKNFLSVLQLSDEDIHRYIAEAQAAEEVITDPTRRGVNLLPFVVLKAVMRQPSTRTGGSMTTAMKKLGGSAELISGMHSSSEAKGETLPDSWVAFATQADVIGTRTAEEFGPALAAHSIDQAFSQGKLWQRVPVINLGDGKNEHPTQALGDLFTIHKRFGQLKDLRIAIVGDHERYRAHHSLIVGAAAVGMEVVAVESPVAPVPQPVVDIAGARLTRQEDLDSAMAGADVLYIGRNPDEYDGKYEDDEDKHKEELERSQQLAAAFKKWKVDLARIQQMDPEAIVMHPRPRRDELDPDLDGDPRMADVEQMSNMIAMRMAIISLQAGKSIMEAVDAAS